MKHLITAIRLLAEVAIYVKKDGMDVPYGAWKHFISPTSYGEVTLGDIMVPFKISRKRNVVHLIALGNAHARAAIEFLKSKGFDWEMDQE